MSKSVSTADLVEAGAPKLPNGLAYFVSRSVAESRVVVSIVRPTWWCSWLSRVLCPQMAPGVCLARQVVPLADVRAECAADVADSPVHLVALACARVFEQFEREQRLATWPNVYGCYRFE